jgi:predicted oxidoreductase
MRWGTWGAMHTPMECASLIERYMSEGVNVFDSANIYGDFSNERLLGEAFALAKLKRDEYQLISKCGIEPAGARGGVNTKHYNYSTEYIISCAEESIRDLKSEYLDLFLLHRPSTLMNYEEIAAAFSYLKDKGLVREFGVSNFTSIQVEGLQSCFPIVHNQVSYSVFNPYEIPVGYGQWLKQKGIAVSTYSPVLGYEDCSEEQIEVFRRLANKYKVNERSLALSWVLKHDWVDQVVLGSSNNARIQSYLNELVELELEDYFALLEATQGRRVP